MDRMTEFRDLMERSVARLEHFQEHPELYTPQEANELFLRDAEAMDKACELWLEMIENGEIPDKCVQMAMDGVETLRDRARRTRKLIARLENWGGEE